MKNWMKMSAFVLMASLMTSMTVNANEKILIGLVTKTESNPFFVKMREGAKKVAKELGVELQSFSGKFDTDNDAQVAAIENLISAGAKGILITPALTRNCTSNSQSTRSRIDCYCFGYRIGSKERG